MTKQHPLKFFLEFIEAEALKQWEDQFFEGAEDEIINDPEYRKEGYIISLTVDSTYGQVERKIHFKDFLTNKFLEQKLFSIQAIDMEVFEAADLEKAIVKLITLKASLQSVARKLMNYEAATAYPFILDIYNELNDHIENHLTYFNGFSHVSRNGGESPIKIKWLANRNMLAQLFFDLLKGQKGAPPFIEIEKPLLEKFIATHFTDEKGKGIKEHTIEKYLRTIDKEGKRTKPFASFIFPPFRKSRSKS